MLVEIDAFKKEKVQKAEELRKLRKKGRWRQIWGSKVYLAHNHYHCDYCIMPIDPGEEYERFVFVNYKYMRIERKHWPDCYAPTEEEVDEVERELDRDRESEQEKSLSETA